MQYLNRILIISLAYFFTGWLGLQVPFESAKVTLFWLPTGIAVTALYRWSTNVWPGIFLGALFVNLVTGASPLINFIIACGNTLGPLVTILLLRRFNCQLQHLQNFTAFTFFSAVSIGMIIPASIGGTALMWVNGIPFKTASYNIFLPWWMGDSLGIFLTAPLLINTTHSNLHKLSNQKNSIFWAISISFAIALACFPFNNFSGSHLPIIFLSFVCVAWAALHFGLFGGAISTLGFSFIAIWSTVHHLGPFAFADIRINYSLIWIYTASMTFLSLMITAAYAEIVTTSTKLSHSYDEQEKQKIHIENAQLMARVAHWSWDIETNTYAFSNSMINLFQLPSHLLEGDLFDFTKGFVHRDDQSLLLAALSEIISEKKPLSIEFRLEIAGSRFWVQAQGNFIDNDVGVIQGTFQDITDRKRLDLALSAAAADSATSPDFFNVILKALAEAIGAEHALISIINHEKPDQVYVHTYLKNGEPQSSTHYSLKDTPCAETIRDDICFIPAAAAKLFPSDEMLVTLGIESYFGVVIKNAEGKPIGILIVMSEKLLPISAQVRSLMLIFAERTSGELRRALDQDKIFNLAFFDPLTQLPNRRMLLDRLKLITAQSERTGQYGALLFIDLDHFKLLNDTRGHHTGDLLLIQVADRINSIIRATDLAARLGGDEFVVVFDNLDCDPEAAAMEAKKRAEELHNLLNLPYPLQTTIFHCTVSIGVNLFNNHNTSIDDLLRHADVAMYQAKDSGRNTIRFFDPHMQALLELRTSIESDLRSAQESKDELIPYYQVQINHQGKAVGAELLLRWRHATKGMISPLDFIPVAEQTGLIIGIGKQVIIQACEQLNRWRTQPEFAHLTIAVNVSPIQFNQEDFVAEVFGIVNSRNINPRLLKFELTESSLLKNVDQSIKKMQLLQNFGIDFSMDDFGIGYSSLSYLKRLPLYQLKIDQTFVRDIASDPNDAIIVRTIIAMAQNMNLNVIAEGVETETQKTFLEQNGCPMFQGYYFGHPLPIEEFEKHLLRNDY
ncbi:MAG: EAL domain-containing protein [Pseudomonadota bacterium]